MTTISDKTGRFLIQLGNSVTWFRNYKMRLTGLSSSQAGVILYIFDHRHQRITAVDLMLQLNLSKATVSGIIKRLEKKGMLIRHTDDNDGRKSVIILTQKGMDLEPYLREVALQTEEILLREMTDEEKILFNGLLQRSLNNMNQLRSLSFLNADHSGGGSVK